MKHITEDNSKEIQTGQARMSDAPSTRSPEASTARKWRPAYRWLATSLIVAFLATAIYSCGGGGGGGGGGGSSDGSTGTTGTGGCNPCLDPVNIATPVQLEVDYPLAAGGVAQKFPAASMAFNISIDNTADAREIRYLLKKGNIATEISATEFNATVNVTTVNSGVKSVFKGVRSWYPQGTATNTVYFGNDSDFNYPLDHTTDYTLYAMQMNTQNSVVQRLGNFKTGDLPHVHDAGAKVTNAGVSEGTAFRNGLTLRLTGEQPLVVTALGYMGNVNFSVADTSGPRINHDGTPADSPDLSYESSLLDANNPPISTFYKDYTVGGLTASVFKLLVIFKTQKTNTITTTFAGTGDSTPIVYTTY